MSTNTPSPTDTYIRRTAGRIGLSAFKWWSSHRHKIEAALQGRYAVIQAGSDPPEVDELIRAIWTSDPRPRWASHYPRGGSTYSAFVWLVGAVDRRARTARETGVIRCEDGGASSRRA
jgi:hypothetical protein